MELGHPYVVHGFPVDVFRNKTFVVQHCDDSRRVIFFGENVEGSK
jgi:hypothetical protein